MTESGSPRRVVVVDDAQRVAQRALDLFVSASRESLTETGRFSVALAGGSTPRALYELLAESDGAPIGGPGDWARIHLFWGDERHVPPDHPDSNYRMAREALLSKVPIPEGNVHRIRAELADASQAAEEYEADLRRFFALSAGALPRFDLILLGMGPDGHTASLFPGTSVLGEIERLIAAPWVEKFRTHRITLTPPVLNAAARVIFLVAGGEKAETLRAVLEGPRDPQRLPAQFVRPHRGELIWLVDRAAARLLSA